MNSKLLMEKLKIVSESIPKNQWRYFNKRTIENYINNVEFIKGKIDKLDTLLILSNYLNDVELNFVPSVDYSINLYEKYLRHVKEFYRELGFALVPAVRSLWLLIPALIFIAFAIKKFLYLEIIYLSMVGIVLLLILIKVKQNKAYGVGY